MEFHGEHFWFWLFFFLRVFMKLLWNFYETSQNKSKKWSKPKMPALKFHPLTRVICGGFDKNWRSYTKRYPQTLHFPSCFLLQQHMITLFSQRNDPEAENFKVRLSDKKGSEFTVTARNNLLIEYRFVSSKKIAGKRSELYSHYGISHQGFSIIKKNGLIEQILNGSDNQK